MKVHMKKIIKIIMVVFILMSASPDVHAASARISASSTSVYVGDSVTITATYTAAAWNLTISGDGVATTKIADVTDDAENATKSKSVSLNTSTPGTYTIRLTGDITDGTTGATSNVNTSVTVTVKEKPQQPANNTNQNNSSNANQSTVTNNNVTQSTTTNKNNTSNTTKNTEIENKNTGVEETLPFGISKLALYGVNENGEKKEIEISPAFDINTYNYSCNVTSDINKIEIEKNANNYDNYIEIIGLEEPLKEGENVIIIKMAKDEQVIEYKIIVNKESKYVEEVSIEKEEVKENRLKENFENLKSSISGTIKEHGICIMVGLILLVVEALVFIIVIKKKYFRKW